MSSNRAKHLTEVMRWSRYAVETWTDPAQFATPQEFAEALTEVLDNLTEAYGKEPVKIEGVWP